MVYSCLTPTRQYSTCVSHGVPIHWPTTTDALDVLVALVQVTGKPGLEQHRVHSELRIEEGHVSKYRHQFIHAEMSFGEVLVTV